MNFTERTSLKFEYNDSQVNWFCHHINALWIIECDHPCFLAVCESPSVAVPTMADFFYQVLQRKRDLSFFQKMRDSFFKYR